MADAAQCYGALVRPELYHTLTVELGWSAAAHRARVTNRLDGELLGTPAAVGSPPLESLSA